MGVRIRPASLQDGIAVLSLLEGVGYYPEPIGFAETYRRTLHDRNFILRIAESDDGRIVGMASLAMRYQLGVGGIVASLDELAILPGPHAKSADRKLRRETVGQARKLGAVRIVQHANEGTPSPRPAAARLGSGAGMNPASVPRGLTPRTDAAPPPHSHRAPATAAA